jgi:hypothetical protein
LLGCHSFVLGYLGISVFPESSDTEPVNNPS